jgi:hypothetical protein
MPKRFGKRETWRRKMRARYYTPEMMAFLRARYNPYFMRGLRACMRCGRTSTGGMNFTFVDQVEYCLDRIEVDA